MPLREIEKLSYLEFKIRQISKIIRSSTHHIKYILKNMEIYFYIVYF